MAKTINSNWSGNRLCDPRGEFNLDDDYAIEQDPDGEEQLRRLEAEEKRQRFLRLYYYTNQPRRSNAINQH